MRNIINIENNTVRILLPSEQYGDREALFDVEDLPRVCMFTWSLYFSGENKAYVKHTGKPFKVSMHRLIMSFPEGMEIDHKNGNGLDNRKNNLRLATRSENIQNTPNRRKVRPARGISYMGGLYFVTIRANRKKVGGGKGFSNLVDACDRYNELARELHGDFFIESTP